LLLLPSLLFSEWTIVPPVTSRNLNGVAWAGSRYVAVGDSGTVLSSTNGADWTVENSGVSVSLYCADGNDSLVIAGGDSGIVCASLNHGAWAHAKAGDSLGLHVACVSCSTIYLGTRNNSRYWYGKWGGPWSTQSTAVPLAGVRWNDSQFVGAGGNVVMTSPDGVQWTGSTISASNLTALVLDGADMFATNRYGVISRIFWMANRWESAIFSGTGANPSLRPLRAAAAYGGRRLAVGDSGIIIFWLGADTPVRESAGTARNLLGTAINDSTAVVVGEKGLILLNRTLTGVVCDKPAGRPLNRQVVAGFTGWVIGNSRIRLPHAGAWEISVGSLNGRLLMRRTIQTDGRSVNVRDFTGGTNALQKNALFFFLREKKP
jgi:hypothetical protein